MEKSSTRITTPPQKNIAIQKDENNQTTKRRIAKNVGE